MPNHISEAKRELRERVNQALRGIPLGARTLASARACELLKAQGLWMTARSILLFAPMPGEVDIWPLASEAFAAGKQICLPRFVAASRSYEACWIGNPATDLHLGNFGIREPNSACVRIGVNSLDLILVPGVAFDLQGHRLGRGKGYYDKLLCATRGITCGVAFEEQIVDEVPVESHDVHLDYVLTPNRWVKVKR